jgi:hypothetical protein
MYFSYFSLPPQGYLLNKLKPRMAGTGQIAEKYRLSHLL